METDELPPNWRELLCGPVNVTQTFASPEHARIYAVLGEIRAILDDEYDAWIVSENARATLAALRAVRYYLENWQKAVARYSNPADATASLCATMFKDLAGRTLPVLVAGKTIRRPIPAWREKEHGNKPPPATLAMDHPELKILLISKLTTIVDMMQKLIQPC